MPLSRGNRSLIICAPLTAIALISSLVLPNTTRRWAGEVELYMWMITFLAPTERFHRALDQILARLHQHLEPDVVRHALFLDQPAVEGEFRVRRRRKSDLDFLEADPHERLEQLQLLRNVHRHGQRLVAIAQIHAAPARRVGEYAVGPLPVRQMYRRKRTVFFRRIFLHGEKVLSIIFASGGCMRGVKSKNPPPLRQWV